MGVRRLGACALALPDFALLAGGTPANRKEDRG